MEFTFIVFVNVLFKKVCMRDEVKLEKGGNFNYHMNMLRISVLYQERFEEFIKIRTMFLIIELILVTTTSLWIIACYLSSNYFAKGLILKYIDSNYL